MANLIYASIFLSAIILQAHGARILLVFPPPSPSHHILANSLATKLTSRGHDVTLMSPFSAKEPVKYKEVVLTGISEIFEEQKQKFVTEEQKNSITQIFKFTKVTGMLLEKTLNNIGIKKLLESKEKFDLIIIDTFQNEATLGLAHHYNATAILLSAVGGSVLVNSYFNNPTPPAYVSDMMLDYPDKMNFWQRLQNTFLQIIMRSYTECVRLPMQEGLLHTYFPEAPKLRKLMNEVSLVLLNSHSSIGTPKPLLPNMIEIGGFHVNEPKQLPDDLKSYLDAADKGFIFFSMGSNIKSSTIPKEILQAFLKVLPQLPYKILWKFEDKMEAIPSNMRIQKWLPQNDILAHPNIKLFITHGGFLSMTEAVYHGVPIVGIPVFGDQVTNMKNAENLGIGRTLKLHDVNEKKFMDVVTEVLNNDKYRNNAKERSKLLKDQPMKPIDTAMYWIEYAVRNKDAKHFKTAGIELKWYQVMLLDVVAFTFASLLTATIVFYLVVKKVCRFICSKTKVAKQKKQKTN